MALSVDDERDAERGELGILLLSFNFSLSFNVFDCAVRSIEEKDTRGALEVEIEVVPLASSTVTVQRTAVQGGREEHRKV